MENAKQELLRILKNKVEIKCAYIYQENGWEEEITKKYLLKLNYTFKEYEDFFLSLDFNYDNGYGGQELFGTVWLKDGTWLSRGEYDSSEWWIHNKLPEIPQNLQ